MTANDQTLWETEEPLGEFKIISIEGCRSKNTRRGGKQRTRRWQRQRTIETSGTSETSASPTSWTSGTSESGRRRRRTPTPTASPTPKPTRPPSEGSATSEWSEMSVSSVGSWTRSFTAMKRSFALQTEDEMRFSDYTASAVWCCALRANVAKSNRRDQRPHRVHDLLEGAVRDFEQDGPSDREVSLLLNSMD